MSDHLKIHIPARATNTQRSGFHEGLHMIYRLEVLKNQQTAPRFRDKVTPEILDEMGVGLFQERINDVLNLHLVTSDKVSTFGLGTRKLWTDWHRELEDFAGRNVDVKYAYDLYELQGYLANMLIDSIDFRYFRQYMEDVLGHGVAEVLDTTYHLTEEPIWEQYHPLYWDKHPIKELLPNLSRLEVEREGLGVPF